MAASVWMKSVIWYWLRPGMGAQFLAPSLGAHDAGGHGEVEAQRVADGQHPLANARAVVGAKRHGGQVLAIDLDHRDVGRRVASHHGALEGAMVGEGDGEPVRPFDHVVVGEDVAVGRDDEARAARLLRLLLLPLVVLVEEILEAGGHLLPPSLALLR